jgi:hypothetical protein
VAQVALQQDHIQLARLVMVAQQLLPIFLVRHNPMLAVEEAVFGTLVLSGQVGQTPVMAAAHLELAV